MGHVEEQVIRHTLPTKSWVLVSLTGPARPSGEGRDEVAIWMTASMSSLVGAVGGLGEEVVADGVRDDGICCHFLRHEYEDCQKRRLREHTARRVSIFGCAVSYKKPVRQQAPAVHARQGRRWQSRLGERCALIG
jgi:hypothetical protein